MSQTQLNTTLASSTNTFDLSGTENIDVLTKGKLIIIDNASTTWVNSTGREIQGLEIKMDIGSLGSNSLERNSQTVLFIPYVTLAGGSVPGKEDIKSDSIARIQFVSPATSLSSNALSVQQGFRVYFPNLRIPNGASFHLLMHSPEVGIEGTLTGNFKVNEVVTQVQTGQNAEGVVKRVILDNFNDLSATDGNVDSNPSEITTGDLSSFTFAADKIIHLSGGNVNEGYYTVASHTSSGSPDTITLGENASTAAGAMTDIILLVPGSTTKARIIVEPSINSPFFDEAITVTGVESAATITSLTAEIFRDKKILIKNIFLYESDDDIGPTGLQNINVATSGGQTPIPLSAVGDRY